MNLGSRAQIWFRVALLVFGSLLAVQAAWIIVPEVLRSDITDLPLDSEAAARARSQQQEAKRDASFAVVRGDLWAESAFAYADLIWTDAAKRVDVYDARMSIQRALAYSPHRGDVWLMLAALGDFNRLDARFNAALKMTYYTAPNELSLLPLRLTISARSHGIEDVEIQDMVRRDLDTILKRRPNLKYALLIAYKSASSENKKFIERAVAEIDPAYVLSLRTQVP